LEFSPSPVPVHLVWLESSWSLVQVLLDSCWSLTLVQYYYTLLGFGSKVVGLRFEVSLVSWVNIVIRISLPSGVAKRA
jgi:hypothetical protein